ncbi:MAG TPA: penicillin-binding protein 2 [Mycobacteriales bacterium]|jgi:cell division protein FtsI (penicillin-binding protein 3)|nr:penicillin-binding protein 2 [Mycobacteriales bacterium]
MLRLGNSRRRITIGFVTLAVLVLVLGGRLVQLQGLDGTHYATTASNQRTYTQVLPSQRGKIVDVSGNVLAYSVEARAIYADPKLIKDPVQTAMALAPLLKQSPGALEAQLVQPKGFVYLAHGLEPKVGDQIVNLGLPGIYQLPESKRLHPAGNVGANIVGFTNADGIGQAGIEQADDKSLTGSPGLLSAMWGRAGEIIPASVHKDDPAVPGSSTQLTISSDLQYYAQNALDAAVKGTKAKGGQLTVQDVKTGKVMAMAATPTYNANNPGATPQLLSNPNVSSVFEPGSANKLITFAGAVQDGLITPRTPFTVPGTIQVADRTIHDDWVHSPVKWTATGILAKSSNVGTLMIADKLGPKTWMDYAKKFGEGQRTGIGLPAESAGLLPAMKDWSGSTFGNLPIGQGVAVTSLQLASMYQAIANDGVRIPPRIIEKVTAPNGTSTTPIAPPSTRVVSAKTAATVRDMLQMVTQTGGTAPKAAIPGYTVGGKTGTGQQLNSACGCYSDSSYWSTFAGFAPADSPRYVISVMVDSPQTDYMGGDVAAPLFHQVMSYALKQGGVPPTGAAPAHLPILAQ